MPNYRAWTAGTKTRKVRGLKAKNWAWLELFLSRLGRRVYFKQAGGLFSKRAGMKRYLRISAVGSRSEGSGRRGTFDLILGVGSGSDGSGVLGAWPAAERAGALCSAAALCGRVTGDGEKVLWGSIPHGFGLGK